CRSGVVERSDRLVETHGGADPSFELGVTDEGVRAEALLDEEQVELVELGEVFDVGGGVCRVRVDLQHHVRVRLAHAANGLDVEAWFDLQLDARISLGDVARYDVEELVDRVGDADGYADLHGWTRSTDEALEGAALG